MHAMIGLAAALIIATVRDVDTRDCSTWYENTQHGSSAFRSVKAFGAAGDGRTDDTAAIQKAIDHNVGGNLQKHPAVVYFPPGRYLLSDTLKMYWHTQLLGNFKCPPTLILQDNAPSYNSSAHLKPVIATDNGFNRSTSSPWWEDTVDKNMLFYAQIHSVDLDLGDGNPGAVGILWAVAQQTSIRNVSISVASGFSGLDVGYPGVYAAPVARPTPGGGGTVEDVFIQGGQYGMRVSASQWLLRAIKVQGSALACILLPNEAWSLSFLDVHVSGCKAGVATSNPLQFLTFVDSTFDGRDGVMQSAIVAATHTSLVSGAPPPPPPALILSQIHALNVEWVVEGVLPGPKGKGGGGSYVESWRLTGPAYLDGRLLPDGPGELPQTRPPPPGGTLPRRSRPTFDEASLASSPPFNAYSAGAKGDGMTDDTAALQAAIDQHVTVFLPYGTYLVHDTLRLRLDSQLVGEGLAVIRLAPHASGFGDENTPKPLLETSADGNAATVLAGLTLEAAEGNYGAILLSWRCGSRSSAFDVHLRMCHAVHTALHVARPAGGGWFNNVWGWGCDHNLTDNTDNTPRLSAATKWLGALSGLRIDSPGPTWLVGTAFEHHRKVMYNITGASDVTLVGAQTENAYWPAGGPPPSGSESPACDARAFLIANASRVNSFGNVWCGWFCHVAAAWANISSAVGGTSRAIGFYGVWSTGADAVAGDAAGPAQVAAYLLS